MMHFALTMGNELNLSSDDIIVQQILEKSFITGKKHFFSKEETLNS